LGALAVGGIALAAFRLGGPRAALVAGVVAAVHPGLALDSAWVMSEALAVPLLLGAWLLWVRYLEHPSLGRACAFGVTAAAASLTRSPALYALGLMVALSLPRRGLAWRPALGQLAAALLVFAACVAPWAVRNAREFHAFVPLDTKAGANLWLNNHPAGEPYREVWDGVSFLCPSPAPVDGLNEAQADRHFGRLATDYIAAHPLTFAGVSAFRLGLALVPVPRYWGRWVAVRAAATALYIALTWFALAGLWKVRRAPAGRALIGIAGGWLLMMAFTAVGLRHRLAAEWAFTVAAAVAAAALWAWAARRASAPPPPPS
jgi:4-amino-4-deoxy-L-arabinose transferase-like glycosyltransferase